MTSLTVSEDELYLLQLACAGQCHLPEEFQKAWDGSPEHLSSLLASLCDKGFLEHKRGLWQPTWLGHRAHNWNLQVTLGAILPAGTPLPVPKDDENGHDLGPPCQQFRPLLATPWVCWCHRLQREHEA